MSHGCMLATGVLFSLPVVAVLWLENRTAEREEGGEKVGRLATKNGFRVLSNGRTKCVCYCVSGCWSVTS